MRYKVVIAFTLALSIFSVCPSWAGAPSKADSEKWIELEMKAMDSRNAGKHKEREKYLRQALTLAETFGENNEMLIDSVRDLGFCLYDQGCYDASEPLLERGLRLSEMKHGKISPEAISCLNMMGRMKRHQNKLDEAEKYASEALNRYRRMARPSCPEKSTLIHNLGRIYQEKGQLDQAEKAYRDAIDNQFLTVNDDMGTLATFFHNLGMLYGIRKDFKTAEMYTTTSLKMRKAAGLIDTKGTAINMSNLATLKAYQGDADGSQKLYKSAIDIFNKGVSADPASVATCLTSYSVLLNAVSRAENRSPVKKEFSVKHGDLKFDFSKLKEEKEIPPMNIKPSILKFLVAKYPVQLQGLSDDPLQKAKDKSNSAVIVAAYLDYVLECINSNKRPEFIEEKYWGKVLELWKKDKRTEALALSFHPERGEIQVKRVMDLLQNK